MAEPSAAPSVREPPRTFWGTLRNIGPGIIVSGSVVGSGELLVTTRMGALVGFIFLWGVILSSVIKYFLQIEIGRYCLTHGTTTLGALNAMPGPRWRGTSWLALTCFIGTLFINVALVGILGSVAGLFHTIVPGVNAGVWAAVVFCAVSLLLVRGLYADVERAVAALVAGFSFIVILSVFLLQGTPLAFSTGDVLSGLTFQIPWGSGYDALAVVGSTGVTAIELFMYPYWVLEKGYPSYIGRREDDPEGWARRAQGWLRVLKTDAAVCTALAVVITIAYYILGASILSRQDIVPKGMDVVNDVSHIFTQSYGGWAYGIFMFGAFCTLFSTLTVFAASAGRMSTDFLGMIGLVTPSKKAERLWHRIFQTGYPLLWLLVILFVQEPVSLILFGANSNNLLLFPLSAGIIFVAFKARRLRSGFAMSGVSAVLLVISTLAVAAFTLINITHFTH